MSKKYIYTGVGVLVLIAVAVGFVLMNKNGRVNFITYTADRPDIESTIPVWMQTKPEIKEIENNIDQVYEYQKQGSCLNNDSPPDKVQCDSLAGRMDTLNQRLQNQIHTFNMDSKSPNVIAAAQAHIRNLREDQTLQVQLTDITDNPYSNSGKNVDLYKDNKGMEYMVDAATNQVVQFVAGAGNTLNFKQTPKLSQAQLKEKAESYLSKHISDFSQVQSGYLYSEASKPDNSSYAFRWEAKTKPAGEDMAPFIQVVLSQAGEPEGFNDTRSLYQ